MTIDTKMSSSYRVTLSITCATIDMPSRDTRDRCDVLASLVTRTIGTRIIHEIKIERSRRKNYPNDLTRRNLFRARRAGLPAHVADRVVPRRRRDPSWGARNCAGKKHTRTLNILVASAPDGFFLARIRTHLRGQSGVR